MDKQERGLLLAEKEEAENQRDNLFTALARAGERLVKFGNALIHTPNSVVFTNAPNEFMFVPRHLRNDPSQQLDRTDWNAISHKEDMAYQLLELERVITRIADLTQQLAGR